MLLLTRFEGQKIIVGDNIVITCFGSKESGEMVVGINAPRDISIDKYETHLYRAKQKSSEKN